MYELDHYDADQDDRGGMVLIGFILCALSGFVVGVFTGAGLS